jgi:beta-glucosidase
VTLLLPVYSIMADMNVDELLQKLSNSEKVDLLAGKLTYIPLGIPGRIKYNSTDTIEIGGSFWGTKSLPQHGIPAVRLTDGPNGARGTKFFDGIRSACFPCGTALGATFNLPLLEEAGRKMGEEAKLKSAHAILGPTINMQRSPLGGRGFESLGEDPFLAGLGAAALVNGIQETGIQATLKHFVCNDQEHKRNAVHSIVTERALREIYALPFQLAIRDSSPSAIMTAYNGLNGVYCSESRKLLEEILRTEWGWDGLVVSDWYGTYSTTDATLAGLDLEMPGPPRFRGEALKFAVSTDKVRQHVLDERVRTVLNFVKKCAATGIPEQGEERTGDTPETAELLRRIGGESLVLLKNERNVLPLKKDKKVSLAPTCFNRHVPTMANTPNPFVRL